ncbi:MAG: mannose-1-phosphate guanylyltransferase [Deltaproteobacteria bacterium]|nr:mannose-1-phosphate guanylyltransferase [Deltaproteobacteria bacterium]
MTTSESSRFAVIMAGGQGTRFWPESTPARPKQLLDLLGVRKSLLRISYERALGLVPPENVIIVTGRSIGEQVREDLTEIPERNILVEPVGRNTSPCVGWAALHVRAADPNGVMAVLPADHFIRDEEAFCNVMRVAMDRAGSANTIVTIGVKPSRPETGYGYIEGGESVDGDVLMARRFVEKPDRLTAEHYLRDGNFFWNAGIFNFTAERILTDIGRFLPDLARGLERIEEGVRGGDPAAEARIVEQVYGEIEGISIDYGVMERKEKGGIEVIPGEFGWSDLGSWGAIYEHLPCDVEGNVVRGGAIPVLEDVKGCLLSTSKPGKVIALCGVEDLVVIDTEDAVLVVPRIRDQEVRKLQKLAKKRKGD